MFCAYEMKNSQIVAYLFNSYWLSVIQSDCYSVMLTMLCNELNWRC